MISLKLVKTACGYENIVEEVKGVDPEAMEGVDEHTHSTKMPKDV